MIDRRVFLQGTAAAGVSALSTGRGHAGKSTRDSSMPDSKPLCEFHYGQISLASGPHLTQFQKTHAVLMGLNEESLLRPYRKHVGLSAPGCDLGGWYSSEDFAGETFGQWLSTLSRNCASTNDEKTRAKVDRLVRALADVVQADPSAKFYGAALGGKGVAYHYDKLVCGLVDAYAYANQSDALNILGAITAATVPHLPGRAIDFFDGGAAESYTLPENQFIAWERSGVAKYLELAKKYLHEGFFGRLAEGQNALPGRHAYSHINALCSAAKAHFVLGDERYLRAVKNGFAFMEAQSFATGAWGPNEIFLPNPGYPEQEMFGLWSLKSMGESLSRAHYHFETGCGSYAHFKLTRYLLRITKNSVYGDSMERVMFNAVLGAKELLPDGRAFYQSDYNFDGRKTYFDGGGGVTPMEWPCCSGTLPQVVADYGISAYFSDESGIYVNLYVPSTLSWRQGGKTASLTQSGSYPLTDEVRMEISISRPQTFSVRLRIPAWAESPHISVNGKRLPMTVVPGHFLSITREWSNGDRVELELPRTIRLEPVDSEHPDLVAAVCGPLVLFAVCKQTPPVTRDQLSRARQVGYSQPEWSVDTASGPLRLMPFWRIGWERYSTYLRVLA